MLLYRIQIYQLLFPSCLNLPRRGQIGFPWPRTGIREVIVSRCFLDSYCWHGNTSLWSTKKPWRKRKLILSNHSFIDVNKRWYRLDLRPGRHNLFPAVLQYLEPGKSLKNRINFNKSWGREEAWPAHELSPFWTTVQSLLTLRALSWLNNKHRTNPSLHFHQTLMSLRQPLSPLHKRKWIASELMGSYQHCGSVKEMRKLLGLMN